MNGNVEQRLTALENQMQDMRDLLQQTMVIVNRTAQIAESNARSVQPWEARIEDNKIEAEEERSRLAVRITESEQANQDNIQQHFAFFQRFDQMQAEIRRILDRLES